jgi:hypothetical protein
VKTRQIFEGTLFWVAIGLICYCVYLLLDITLDNFKKGGWNDPSRRSLILNGLGIGISAAITLGGMYLRYRKAKKKKENFDESPDLP